MITLKKEEKNRMNWIARLERPENVFAFFSILVGTIFIFLFPPFSAPDELGHFAKPYAFTEGIVIPESNGLAEKTGKTWMTIGFYLPKGVVELYRNSEPLLINGDLEFNYSTLKPEKYEHTDREFTYLGGQTSYSFVQYIPQIIGISIGKIFSKSALTLYFMAKMANLIAYIIFIYLAIKISRFTKWGIAVLSLNPMALELASSSSGDGFTIALTFLFVSIMTKLITQGKVVKISEIMLALVLQILLIQMKPTMIVFGLLFFLIPNKIFSIKRKLLLGTITIAIALGWYYLWGRLFPNNDYIYRDYGLPSEQTRFIVEHPIDFIRACIKTIKVHSITLFHGYSGNFSWLNRPAEIGLSYFFIGIAIFSLFVKDFREKVEINFLTRIVSLVLLGLYILLNFLALYQIWSQPGSDIIAGLQGRYFIPSATVGILVILPNRIKIDNKIGSPILVFSIGLLLLKVTAFLLSSYGVI